MEFITHFVGFLLGYFFKVSNLAGLPLHSVGEVPVPRQFTQYWQW